jgi:hypothetical protein
VFMLEIEQPVGQRHLIETAAPQHSLEASPAGADG